MKKKKHSNPGGIVYSTDPDFASDQPDPVHSPLPPREQRLMVRADSRQRAGRIVTLVEGFAGNQDELEALARELKLKCGSGGNAREGTILIQGDYVTKVRDLLRQLGYGLT